MAQYKQISDSTFIGAQPTEQDLSDAKRQGIRTVIDLRPFSETAGLNAHLTTKHGMHYVNVPVDKAALSTSCVKQLDEALVQNEGPYLLHCASGTRAAMLLALSLARKNGWTAERTFQEAESMGFNLQNSADFANFVKQETAKNT